MKVTKNGISLTYTGTGSEAVSVSAETNEGLDRSAAFDIVTNVQDVRAQVVVTQSGKRETFTDGAWLLSDGTTFNVLKNGI